MPQLPLLSGKEIRRAFEKIGYTFSHQRGSHMRLHHGNRPPITVPNYPVVGRGLLRKIIRDAKLPPEGFLQLLK
ncbi:MAG TPA: hypothetical protein DEF00_03145 [Candidatus Taylorbacteria bacterium]|nr:hypothetical protein [Candidatus Taylorbacteria bacterium]